MRSPNSVVEGFLHWKVDSTGPPSGLCYHMELSAVAHVQSFAQTSGLPCFFFPARLFDCATLSGSWSGVTLTVSADQTGRGYLYRCIPLTKCRATWVCMGWAKNPQLGPPSRSKREA